MQTTECIHQNTKVIDNILYSDITNANFYLRCVFFELVGKIAFDRT